MLRLVITLLTGVSLLSTAASAVAENIRVTGQTQDSRRITTEKSRTYQTQRHDINPTLHRHENLRSFMERQQGRVVTLRLSSGQDVTGTIRTVGDQLLHITHLSGKSYFDAVVPLNRIDSVQFKARH